MTPDTRISSVMSTDFLRLTPEMPIRDAVRKLLNDGTPAAPVVDDTGTLVGILTQKDCFRSALNASYYQQWSGTVAQYLTEAVHSLPADTDIVTAAEAFIDQPFRAYPVLQDGRLVGMLNRADLLETFLVYG
ncbi:CBS domain-containing protein [Psychromarinibacter sp. S121]|uniref:CBS domain-containing protein n=1 Tax=Psychromarinibacter sp. S121 TaxID=3415127 RepID=UPI003C79D31A